MQRPSFNSVEYLVAKRFPDYCLLELPPSLSEPGRGHVAGHDRQRRLDEIEAYRAVLKSKSPEELTALVAQEHAKESQLRREKADRAEQERFNKASDNADFAHWTKAAYWTIDEALALTFGKAPETVSWKVVEPYVKLSLFAQAFARVRDLALRAQQCHQLSDPVAPGAFLAWARRLRITVSAKLIEEVEASGITVADWQDNYEKVKLALDDLLVDRDKIARICERLIEERNGLKQRVVELSERAAAWEFDDEEESYPAELDIAMQAWWAASKHRDSTLNPKQQIAAWLGQHYPKLSGEARERIATLCNWEKRGGRRPQEQ